MSFNIFISEYILILFAMALILFTTNEVVRLMDQVRIMWITYKVRKLASYRHNQPQPTIISNDPTSEPGEAVETPVWRPKPRQDTREWNAPKVLKINPWIIAGSAVALLLFGLMYYILGVYDPSGGR